MNSINIYSEVPYPYLFFDSSDIKNGDTRFKNEPPIYDALNKKMLINAIHHQKNAKIIELISSFHSAIPNEYKFYETEGNFRKALNGFHSIGLQIQIVWNMLYLNARK
jgi:dihydroorotase-like cyclic amidohydrolase